MRKHRVSYEGGDVVYFLYQDEDDKGTIMVHNNMQDSLLDTGKPGDTEIHINLSDTSVEEVKQMYGDDVAQEAMKINE